MVPVEFSSELLASRRNLYIWLLDMALARNFIVLIMMYMYESTKVRKYFRKYFRTLKVPSYVYVEPYSNSYEMQVFYHT